VIPACLAGIALTLPTMEREEPSWRFDAFVYYWSASVDGNLTVDGDEIDIDEGDGGDGFSGDPALLGFLGNFEASRGPWTFVLAPIFVNVSTEGDESPGVTADVEIRAQVHEAFVAHDLGGDWQWMAGARYYDLETEIDLSQGGVPIGSPDNDHAWVDPIVGVRWLADLGESWSLRARADIGGFGLGSDFAWNASTQLGYSLASWARLFLGYRALDFDFADGSGSDRVEYDVRLWGPLIGVSFDL